MRRGELPVLGEPDELELLKGSDGSVPEIGFARTLRALHEDRAGAVAQYVPVFQGKEHVSRYLRSARTWGVVVSVAALVLLLATGANNVPEPVLARCRARGTVCPPDFPKETAVACIAAFSVLIFIDVVTLFSIHRTKVVPLQTDIMKVVLTSNCISLCLNILAYSGVTPTPFKVWVGDERGFDSGLKYAVWSGTAPLTIISLGAMSRIPTRTLTLAGVTKGLSLLLHCLALQYGSAHVSTFWLLVTVSTAVYCFSFWITIQALLMARRTIWQDLWPLVQPAPIIAVWGVYISACAIVTAGWALTTSSVVSFETGQAILTVGELLAKAMSTLTTGLLYVSQSGIAAAFGLTHHNMRAVRHAEDEDRFANFMMRNVRRSITNLYATTSKLEHHLAEIHSDADTPTTEAGIAPSTGATRDCSPAVAQSLHRIHNLTVVELAAAGHLLDEMELFHTLLHHRTNVAREQFTLAGLAQSMQFTLFELGAAKDVAVHVLVDSSEQFNLVGDPFLIGRVYVGIVDQLIEKARRGTRITVKIKPSKEGREGDIREGVERIQLRGLMTTPIEGGMRTPIVPGDDESGGSDADDQALVMELPSPQHGMALQTESHNASISMLNRINAKGILRLIGGDLRKVRGDAVYGYQVSITVERAKPGVRDVAAIV